MSKMLPALPSGFGNLRHVLPSVVDSVLGRPNELKLAKANNALVIMIDGLGWHNFNNHMGHAPFLRQFLSAKLYCAFPSTTAASVVSIATGVTPSQHGIIGYRVFDRRSGESISFLSSLAAGEARRFIHSEQIIEPDTEFFVVTKPEYRGSGFTQLSFPDAQESFASNIEDRFQLARDILARGKSKVVYLYIPELDQTAHKFGSESDKWLALLELVDSQTKKLILGLPKFAGVVITADHGVIDVLEENHIFLDECEALKDKLLECAGDPRANFIYLKPGEQVDWDAVSEWLGNRGQLVTWQEAIKAGLYQFEVERFSYLAPDWILFAAKGYTAYHRDYAKPTSLKMIGQHGGITDEELAVPLFRLGAYSSSDLVP